MAMSKEEGEVFIDLYQEMLDKLYDELAEEAESIQNTKIDINEGKAGFDAAKKIITKKFREANVVWNIVLYLEDTISDLKEEVSNTKLEEHD